WVVALPQRVDAAAQPAAVAGPGAGQSLRATAVATLPGPVRIPARPGSAQPAAARRAHATAAARTQSAACLAGHRGAVVVAAAVAGALLPVGVNSTGDLSTLDGG